MRTLLVDQRLHPIGAEVEAIQEIGNPHEPSFEQIAALNAEILIVPPSFQQFATTVEATGTKIVYSNMNSVDDIKKRLKSMERYLITQQQQKS